MTHVSLKDVAARAGVSFQTVSKVLKGKGNVSPETRTWILQVAEELGYVPNAVARSLVSQRTSTIGIVASDFNDYVLAQFVVGAEREARRQDQCVIVGSIDQEGHDSERYLRLLMERRVDGILLAAPQLELNARIGEMLQGQLPVVSFYRVPGANFPVVGSSHSQTGYLATQHLLELGHRRIGTISGPIHRRAAQSRLHGYQRALHEAGIMYTPELVEEGNWQVEGGYEAAQRLLERVPDITAIFAQNDTMAVGVLSALHERGQRVPQDCAVVGCDDIPIATHTIPSLTTVHLPFYETGEVAMRLLLDIITQRIADPPERTLLPVYLVNRRSSGCHNNTSTLDGFSPEKEIIGGED
ncbi:MAG TPA: LacI family DNA-binding transcriptional regulator [Ktedonobacteraceae bacterium]|nr:LacI family DNA-binding transcriptional regulator [Ktedonobacteraceae bacterium]